MQEPLKREPNHPSPDPRAIPGAEERPKIDAILLWLGFFTGFGISTLFGYREMQTQPPASNDVAQSRTDSVQQPPGIPAQPEAPARQPAAVRRRADKLPGWTERREEQGERREENHR